MIKKTKLKKKKTRSRSIASSDGLIPNGVRYREDGEKPEEGTSISKVQIKAMDSEGVTVFNKEDNKLENDGTLTYTFTNFVRHQPFTVQTNIKKEGKRRNFVVKTNNKVYLLPDPSVESLENPEKVIVQE